MVFAWWPPLKYLFLCRIFWSLKEIDCRISAMPIYNCSSSSYIEIYVSCRLGSGIVMHKEPQCDTWDRCILFRSKHISLQVLASKLNQIILKIRIHVKYINSCPSKHEVEYHTQLSLLMSFSPTYSTNMHIIDYFTSIEHTTDVM